MKKEDDPLALRVSLGGSEENVYIVYRGDINKIKSLMTQCYRAIMAVEKDLEVSPEGELKQ